MPEAKVTAEINGDASGLENAVAKANQSVSAFGRGALSSVGGQIAAAFSVGAVASFASSLMRSADAVVDVAKGLGMSAKEVVALKKAGDEAGVSFDRVQALTQKLADAQQKALAGGAGSEMAKSFEQLGVSFSDLMSMGPVELMKAFADATAQGGVSVAALDAVMGRAAAVDFIDAFGGMANETLPAFIDRMGAAAEAVSELAAQQQRLNSAWTTFRDTAAQLFGGILEGYESIAAIVGKMSTGMGFGASMDQMATEKTQADEAKKAAEEKRVADQKRVNEKLGEEGQSKKIQDTLKEWRKQDASSAKRKEAGRKAQDVATDPEWESVVSELETKAKVKTELDAIIGGKGISTMAAQAPSDQARIGNLQGMQNDPTQRHLERQTEIQKEMLRVLKENKISPQTLREILEGN